MHSQWGAEVQAGAEKARAQQAAGPEGHLEAGRRATAGGAVLAAGGAPKPP